MEIYDKCEWKGQNNVPVKKGQRVIMPLRSSKTKNKFEV
jgi:hypothetical protein